MLMDNKAYKEEEVKVYEKEEVSYVSCLEIIVTEKELEEWSTP